MQHLREEDLARLVEEEPTANEAIHLRQCEVCRADLEALREQTWALSDLPELAPRPEAWRAIQGALAAEGLIGPARAERAWTRPLLRVAAGLALFLSGGVAGATGWGGAGGEDPLRAAAAPGTPAEAAERLRQAEADYTAALAQYTELAGMSGAIDPLNRLAALEGIVLTTRAALEEAPADPVINGYHLTALGQRDAMLQQIARTPPGAEQEEEWY